MSAILTGVGHTHKEYICVEIGDKIWRQAPTTCSRLNEMIFTTGT